MLLYSDTELDSDIKYMKEFITKYSHSYKEIEKKLLLLNETVSSRFYFISSQFKNLIGRSCSFE